MLFSWKISFGGIPSSRNVLFLQIFLKRSGEAKRWKPCPDLSLHQRFPKPSPRPALQPSPDSVEPDLGLHQGFLEPFQEISPEPCCTCPGSAPKNLLRNLLRKHVEPNLALHQILPHLLRILVRNLVELDRRLQQCTPELFWAEGPISLGRWGKKRCSLNTVSTQILRVTACFSSVIVEKNVAFLSLRKLWRMSLQHSSAERAAFLW